DESIGKKLFEVSLKEFLELIEPDEAVVLLGTDNLHRLYRCELRRGAAAPPQKVGAAEWDYTRFHAWKVEYPRKYGMDVQIYYGHLRGPAPGQVAETIAGLLPAGRFGTKLGTIVTEGRLFSFAHRLAAEIAGDHTATTVAPSARWLAGMRRSELKGAGAVAWLASAPAGDQAMGTLYAELPAVFAQSGIARLESGILPDLASRKLVVIGCHGRGSNQEGFVQLMDGDTAYEPDAVANRVADSTVVVLFVCHGGRGDEALYSHETAGLTSSLLSHGVRAVVAALWPLDASLAAPWLEEFGKTDRGASVVERVDQAQRAVARRPAFAERFGEHPLVKTAFTVFGDGVVRLDWPE
ncbi:MAG TPA: CHAT domain-containing protein, partial [Lacunisphaera sp.]